MASVKPISESKLEISIVLKLSEDEARALKEITGYGHKPFTDWFYKHLGRHYLQPHERGLISLFETIKTELPQHLKKIDAARKAVGEILRNY